MYSAVEVVATPIPHECLRPGQELEAFIDGDYAYPHNKKQVRKKKLLKVRVLEVIRDDGRSAVRIHYVGCQHGPEGIVVERLYRSPSETAQ